MYEKQLPCQAAAQNFSHLQRLCVTTVTGLETAVGRHHWSNLFLSSNERYPSFLPESDLENLLDIQPGIFRELTCLCTEVDADG